jgi:uncharacterized protein YndB with AHSA1/START domain
MGNKKITIEATVQAPAEKVWSYWNGPTHIQKWANASDDWHTPRAETDLKVGGKFLSRMEARDGSVGFDFGGVYDAITIHEYIAYTIDDGRKVSINFYPQGNATRIVQTFEAENVNPLEMQQGGWQAILNSFKKYAESN